MNPTDGQNIRSIQGCIDVGTCHDKLLCTPLLIPHGKVLLGSLRCELRLTARSARCKFLNLGDPNNEFLHRLFRFFPVLFHNYTA